MSLGTPNGFSSLLFKINASMLQACSSKAVVLKSACFRSFYFCMIFDLRDVRNQRRGVKLDVQSSASRKKCWACVQFFIFCGWRVGLCRTLIKQGFVIQRKGEINREAKNNRQPPPNRLLSTSVSVSRLLKAGARFLVTVSRSRDLDKIAGGVWAGPQDGRPGAFSSFPLVRERLEH